MGRIRTAEGNSTPRGAAVLGTAQSTLSGKARCNARPKRRTPVLTVKLSLDQPGEAAALAASHTLDRCRRAFLSGSEANHAQAWLDRPRETASTIRRAIQRGIRPSPEGLMSCVILSWPWASSIRSACLSSPTRPSTRHRVLIGWVLRAIDIIVAC
jgi:hypothetical protein